MALCLLCHLVVINIVAIVIPVLQQQSTQTSSSFSSFSFTGARTEEEHRVTAHTRRYELTEVQHGAELVQAVGGAKPMVTLPESNGIDSDRRGSLRRRLRKDTMPSTTITSTSTSTSTASGKERCDLA